MHGSLKGLLAFLLGYLLQITRLPLEDVAISAEFAHFGTQALALVPQIFVQHLLNKGVDLLED